MICTLIQEQDSHQVQVGDVDLTVVPAQGTVFELVSPNGKKHYKVEQVTTTITTAQNFSQTGHGGLPIPVPMYTYTKTFIFVSPLD